MSDIIKLDAWLKAQADTFTTKKRLLVFTDIIHTPSGSKVIEGYRYFTSDIESLLAAFDADDLAAIAALPYALDYEGEADTSGVCILLAYTSDGAFLAAQPQQYIDYVPTLLREPKYLTIGSDAAQILAGLDQTR